MNHRYENNFQKTCSLSEEGPKVGGWHKAVIMLAVALAALQATAQVTIIQNSNSQTLSQLLAGTGVTITNYTKSCANNGTGTFNNVSSNLGLTGGVVMASGNVTNISQPANNFASTQFTLTGDAQLSTLTGGTIYDPCVLEFDIVPQGPLLRFNYVFASEEYPEWVCSQFNDVFGFFISGPKPGGGNYTNQNIAIIPNTNLPVAINTINAGVPGANAGGGTCSGSNQSLAYSSLYKNNLSPVNPVIVYDAQTHVLQATIAVTPCQSYHLKIAIADVADRIYDSGVFLEAYSFTSNPISVSAVSALQYAGFSSAYEGCVNGTFTLTLSQVQQTDVFVNLAISGTATNGTDYTTIPAVVMIPAGQTTLTIPLTPLADGLTEAPETVTLAVLDPCTGAVSSSASITIRDDIPPSITVSDSTLCLGQSAQLNANGGLTYTWSPAAGLSSATVKNPIATPTVTTTYTVTMTWGSCTKTASQTIYVSNPTNIVNATPAGTICNGGTVTLTSAPTNGQAPYSYLWSTGATTPTTVVATSGTYIVTATDNFGCSASASRTVTISNLNITGVTTNVTCLGANNGTIDITVTGSNAPFTYNWGGGVTTQDRTNLAAGTYTVTASNTVGCSVTAFYTITQPAAALTSTATQNNIICNGLNNGSINLTVNGGVAPYTFNWSNGATTEDVATLSAAVYTVTITDFNGCTATRTVSITQPPVLATSSTQINVSCNGGNTGSVDLSVSGGVAPYVYSWSNGISTQDIFTLTAGAYSVTVADSNGCTATRSVNITQPTAINISLAATNVACNGGNTGSINTTVTGGTGAYTYNWGGGITTQNRTSLVAGTYTVTATDANGCTATATATIAQPAVLTVSNTATNISCNGGSNGAITTTVTGGNSPYSYNWGGGITTPNRAALATGTYTVTVTSTGGCTATASSTITQPTALNLSAVATPVSCNGGNNGSIDLTVSGGTGTYTYNWTGGVTTQDRSNLTAGSFTVTVTDANACTATASYSITQPAVLSTSFTSVNPVCNGGSTGSINTTITGGNSPYTFLWNDGTTTQNRTGLAAGVYQITVTDNKGCTAAGSRTITQPTAIAISPSVTNASCAVGNDGSISLAVSGGTAPYTYNWGGGIITQNRTNLVAGTYTVTVTDNAGCTASQAVNVTQIGSGITLSSSATNVLCFGANTGAIDVTASTSNPPLNYNWGGGVTTEDRTNLVAGTYSVTVTDAAGCSAVSTNTITQPTTALSVTKITGQVSCFGGNDGFININVNGGTAPYTYNWGGGITTQNRSSLTNGTYTVTVTDNVGCTLSNTTTITQPASALSVSTTPTHVLCFGGNSGAVNTTVSGGTVPYTFAWSNGGVSQNISTLASGTFTITVTDSKGCTAQSSATVNQPAAVLSVSFSNTHVLCNGASTGSINLTANGGTTPYTFNWGGGITTEDRAAIAAGTYSVTVTDNQSCTVSGTTTINQPTALSVTLTKTNISCNGGNNGTITTTASGGTGTLSFIWNDGVTTQNRSGLSAATYTVTTTDANLCTATAAITISQPTALTLSMNSGTSVCLNPTGTATAVTNNSGTAPYTFTWSNGGPNSQTLNGLAPGSISVTVTDANSCSASSSVTVGLSGNNTNANFNFSGSPCAPAAPMVFTHAGSNNLTAHYWSFGTGDTSAMPSPSYMFASAGVYNVQHIVYRGFCTDTITKTVTVHPKPVIAPSVNNILCNGVSSGSITLNVTSGTTPYGFNWGGGITTQNRTSLAPGSYAVTVTDANNCSASFATAITQPTPFVVTNTTTTVSCNGGNNGAINLSVSGATPGYTFAWSNGATTQNLTALPANTYVVTITDANSCTTTSSVLVYEPSPLAPVLNVTNISCNGLNNGAIDLTVSGGTSPYTYNWGGGITTQNRVNLSASTYTVTVTDNKLCSATASATVTQPTPLSTTLSASNVSCFGGNNGTILVATTGGTSPYNYVWNDGSTTSNRSSLSAGTYTTTTTDVNGCTAVASVVINQPATALSVTVASASTLLCYGNSNGSININVTGGTPTYTYLWSDGATIEDRTNMMGGTYFITASDNNNCTASTSATIQQPAAPLVIDTLVVTNAPCFGANTGSITTQVSGGTTPYSYLWNGGVTTANRTNVAAGIYNVTVTDANNCSSTSSATITQPTALVVSNTTTNVNCYNQSTGAIDVTVSGGITPYTYSWNDGANTEDRTNISSGNYVLTVADNNSCTATTSATITQPSAALSVSLSPSAVLCFGGNSGSITSTTTGGTTGYTYLWNDGVSTANRALLIAGSYTLTVTDANSCTAVASTTVTQPAGALTITAPTVVPVSCFGGNNGSITTSTTGGTTPYTYLWNGGATTANRTSLTAGSYAVTVTDANNCTASIAVTITQPAQPMSVVLNATNVSCNNGANGTINTTISNGVAPYTYIWNDGNATANRTMLPIGTYAVTVTDNNTCTATATTTLTQPTAINIQTTKQDVNCYGGNDGSITTTVSGGAGGYSFNWSNAATTQNISNLSSGSYTITVTDANNCTLSNSTTINQPAQLQASTITGNVSCAGGTNGTVTITVSGGVVPYLYDWNNGISGQSIGNLPAGSYTVTVYDSHNCTVNVTINITQPSPIVTSTALTHVLCNGANTGAIDLTVSGGTSSYTYNWGNNITTEDRGNLQAGTYAVTITDANACTATVSSTITQPTALTVSNSATNVSCYNQNTGAITVNVNGGVTPYSFAWNDAATTQNRNNLAAGNYMLTVTDNNACTASTAATITQPNAVLNVVLTPSAVLCYGGNTGSINSFVTGGTSPYTYAWSDGASTNNRTALSAATYVLTVTDNNNCTFSTSATITQPSAALNISVAGTTNVFCFGGTNGAINTNTTGGTTPYSYLWNGGVTTANRTNVAAGIYNVTVTDANNCSSTSSATITQPTALVVSNTTTNVNCYNQSTGAIDVTVNGGVTPYTYSWNDGANTEDRTNISSGNYVLTVTDNNSCTATTSATITQPSAALSVSLSPSAVLCFGGNSGSITSTTTGGTTGYTYLWNDGVTTANRGTLIAGTYTLTVTDANSCTAVASTTVTQPAGALTITAPTVVPVSCFGGSNGGITTATTGGTTPYTYLWNGGATTANRTSLTADSYSVTVTDANNCTASIAVTITQPSAPLGVSLTKTDALCNGANSGSITSTVSGGTTGYTYIWSNSFTNQNLANVPAGVYTVTVEDANLCTASSSVTVGQPTAINITETHINVVCNGNLTGAIDITPTGGTGNYTYNWTNGSNAQDLSGIAAGNYTITVTDANNCTASQTILVIEPSAFNVSLQYNNVSCNGGNDGNINLTVSGSTPGYTFQWNNQATTEDLNNIPAGNYFVIIRDANNCVANANLTITQPNSIVVVTNTHTNVSCFGGSNGFIDITIQGGTIPFTFIWSDGANTEDRTNLSAGTYQLTVNDVNSCAVSQPVIITEPTALNVTLSTTNVSCFGGTNGTITSIVTGGTIAYSYSWNTGSTQSQINNVSAANYSLTVTDSQGCQQIANTAVTQPVQLSINGIKTDVTCSGMNNGSIDVLTSGGVTPYVFNWSNNAVTEDINNLSPATYTITATDANNCSLSSSWAITQPQPLQAVIAKQDPSCNGAANGLVDLTVNGGTPNYTFVWNSNSSINTEDIANAIAGTYAVAVTDANGCLTSASTVLNQPAAMAINTTSTMPSCFGGADGSIQVSIIGGTPSYIYNWSNGASTAFVQNLSAGSYSLTVTDANGCTASQNTVSVSEPSLLGVGIQVTNVACFGASTGAVQATVSGGTPNYTYMWSNNATTKDLSNVAAGSYQLTVTDSKGCTANANAFINTLPPMLGVGETDNLVCAQDLGGVDLTITQGTAPYTYQWSNGSTNEDLTNVGTGTYYVQVTDANGCKFDTSFTIINTNQFSVTASGGGTIILGEYVDLSAVSTGSPQTTYQWTPNFGFPCATCTDVTIQPGHSTTYTVVATDVNGCIAQDTVSVTVIVNHEIFTPNAFTPNGDGNNDIFQLYGNLAAIKKFDLMIFDRWGEKVFDAVADPYFKWDGTYKGATLDPQVLVYVMKVTMLDGTVLKTFKGSITILR